MNSGNKILGLLLALVVIAAVGCAKKQQPQAPVYGSGVAPASQPMINASAPAASRSNNYIK